MVAENQVILGASMQRANRFSSARIMATEAFGSSWSSQEDIRKPLEPKRRKGGKHPRVGGKKSQPQPQQHGVAAEPQQQWGMLAAVRIPSQPVQFWPAVSMQHSTPPSTSASPMACTLSQRSVAPPVWSGLSTLPPPAAQGSLVSPQDAGIPPPPPPPSPLPATQKPISNASSEEEDDDSDWAPRSTGSYLHTKGGCVPCKFLFTVRGCRDGTQCARCHYPHPEMSRSARRKNIRRTRLAAIALAKGTPSTTDSAADTESVGSTEASETLEVENYAGPLQGPPVKGFLNSLEPIASREVATFAETNPANEVYEIQVVNTFIQCVRVAKTIRRSSSCSF